MKAAEIAAVAVALALGSASSGHAATYTGTLAGNFGEFLQIGSGYESRPIRITFTADMTQVPYAYLTASFDRYFEGTFDNGSGLPRDWYGDTIDFYENYTSALTPTGFRLLIDTPDNATCSPYKGPDYYCDHVYLTGFYLDGEVLGDPVPYSYTVSVVPEASTWSMMIAGFGLAGAGLRRSRGQRRAQLQLQLQQAS